MFSCKGATLQNTISVRFAWTFPRFLFTLGRGEVTARSRLLDAQSCSETKIHKCFMLRLFSHASLLYNPLKQSQETHDWFDPSLTVHVRLRKKDIV